jgi:hypothetical protein
MSEITRTFRGPEVRILSTILATSEFGHRATVLSVRHLQETLPYGGYYVSLLPAGTPWFLFLCQGTMWLFDPETHSTETILETLSPGQTLAVFAVIRLRENAQALWIRDVLMLRNKRVGVLDFVTRMLVGRRYLATTLATTQRQWEEGDMVTQQITGDYRLHFFPVSPVSESRRVWSCHTSLPIACDGLYFMRGQTRIDYQMDEAIFHWYRTRLPLCVVVTALVENIACLVGPPYDGSTHPEDGTEGYTLYIRHAGTLRALGQMYTTRIQCPLSTIQVHWDKGWTPLAASSLPTSTLEDVRRVVGYVSEDALPSSQTVVYREEGERRAHEGQ